MKIDQYDRTQAKGMLDLVIKVLELEHLDCHTDGTASSEARMKLLRLNPETATREEMEAIVGHIYYWPKPWNCTQCDNPVEVLIQFDDDNPCCGNEMICIDCLRKAVNMLDEALLRAKNNG